jgi:hypothetical protein
LFVGAEKLIGVTWDVGHINMMRKHGAQDRDILKQTEKVAPFVKHIHLSDNFGLEHTELPMGMGNVPIKEHEALLKKQFGEKFSKIKQIVETGAWFRNFNNVTPFAETLEAFGSGMSGIYPMKMASTWNATRGGTSPYFTGYGRMLPDINFSTYGAGFSSLPAELGGQVAGTRNRLSGNLIFNSYKTLLIRPLISPWNNKKISRFFSRFNYFLIKVFQNSKS